MLVGQATNKGHKSKSPPLLWRCLQTEALAKVWDGVRLKTVGEKNNRGGNHLLVGGDTNQ